MSPRKSLRLLETLVARSMITSCFTLFACLLCAAPAVQAQQQGTPGKFDFYLLDMPWGPAFCDIKDVSTDCTKQRGFMVHGLWPQNFDGTWPVFCSKEAGPASYDAYLKLTPNLQLLHHEWDKHGTCSGVGPSRFFQMERDAFQQITIPTELTQVHKDVTLTPEWILMLFRFANPGLPAGSMVLSCSRDGKLTAVEACFDKNLHAMKCGRLHPCVANAVTIQAPAQE